jgi:biopolymer transport protein ExbD
MKLTPLQRRAERRSRHGSMVDMNLVSLIDVFTILIFFLLSSASGVELLASPKSVHLPVSDAERAPRQTIVVVVSDEDILVEGRKVAAVGDVIEADGDVIAPLQAELELLRGRRTLTTGAAEQARAVTVMADKDIPYRLLRKVMVTSARADFTDVAFAVRRKDGT